MPDGNSTHESGEYSHKGRGAAGGGAEVLEEHSVLVLHGLQPLDVAVLNGLAAGGGGVVCGIRTVAHLDGDDDGDGDCSLFSVVFLW